MPGSATAGVTLRHQYVLTLLATVHELPHNAHRRRRFAIADRKKIKDILEGLSHSAELEQRPELRRSKRCVLTS